MKFKVNKIAVAVAVSLGTSVVGMKAAQADEILFPYVVASDTVTTLISTINIFEEGFFLDSQIDRLHYRYYYKNGSTITGSSNEGNTAPCFEVNERLPSSPNDIVTFDVAGRFGADNLGIVFEDAATSQNVNYGRKSFSLLEITPPVRAFLVVDNNDFFTGAGFRPGFSSTADTLAGEAIVLQFTTGAAWGYAAYNAAGVYGGTSARDARRLNPYDFSDAVETAGEVIGPTSSVSATTGEFEFRPGAVPVALAPFTATGGEWITKFFVTPILGSRFDDNGNWEAPGRGGQLQGNLNARVRLAVQDPSSATQDVMFDRDELPVSGQVPQNVVCVGAVDATSMITEGALQRMPDGGWSNLVVDRGTVRDVVQTNEAIVIKLEYNPESLTLNGTTPVAGTVNNAIWLRDGNRESLKRPLTTFAVGLDLNSPAPIGITFAQ